MTLTTTARVLLAHAQKGLTMPARNATELLLQHLAETTAERDVARDELTKLREAATQDEKPARRRGRLTRTRT